MLVQNIYSIPISLQKKYCLLEYLLKSNDISLLVDHLDLSISEKIQLTTNNLDILTINLVIDSLNTAYYYG